MVLNFPALKKSLENNGGSIFRYADHENTVLNKLKDDLYAIQPADMNELANFISQITEWKVDKTKHEGPRNMIDLADVVRSVYYSPTAGGSNSLKKILPAIINDAPGIKELYSKQDLYGKGKNYSSRNFSSHVWITEETDYDPYQTLPPIPQFEGIDENFFDDDLTKIADGSAAMMAYNKLQWSHITEQESLALREALLKYCELDTLAMVMLVQGLMELNNRTSY